MLCLLPGLLKQNIANMVLHLGYCWPSAFDLRNLFSLAGNPWEGQAHCFHLEDDEGKDQELSVALPGSGGPPLLPSFPTEKPELFALHRSLLHNAPFLDDSKSTTLQVQWCYCSQNYPSPHSVVPGLQAWSITIFITPFSPLPAY